MVVSRVKALVSAVAVMAPLEMVPMFVRFRLLSMTVVPAILYEPVSKSAPPLLLN